VDSPLRPAVSDQAHHHPRRLLRHRPPAHVLTCQLMNWKNSQC
jgi:hypothetical protein